MYRRGPRPNRRGRRHRPARSVAGQLKPGDILVEVDGLSPAQVNLSWVSGFGLVRGREFDRGHSPDGSIQGTTSIASTITKVILAVAHRRCARAAGR